MGFKTLSLLLAVVLSACGDAGATPDPTDGGTDSGPAPTPDAGPDPILAQRSIDAANAYSEGDEHYAGQLHFLWDAWGVEVLDHWPPAEFMIALQTEEPEVFGNQFEAFGFIADPDDDLPVGFKRGLSDPTRVNETCAMCHVARLEDGRLWLGAPNGRLDVGRFRVEVNRRWVASGHPSMMTELEQEKALLLGPGRFNAETSDHPQVVAADFPPYFRLGQHAHMNYLGTGRNVKTEVYLAIYSFGAGSPNPRDAVVPFPPESRLTAFVGFLGSLAAPAPPPQDAASVEAGRTVFVRERCIDCHHDDPMMNEVTTTDSATDGRERFPGEDAAFPRGSIRTDLLHRVIQEGDSMGMGADEGIVDIFNFIIRYGLRASPTDGYRVPDLTGIWMTGPYLHNGSVPTLEDVLRPPAERPTSFMRNDYLIDTSLPGNSNQGHEFGTSMSEADRTALAAYLRSL
jgi:hypothetical protein